MLRQRVDGRQPLFILGDGKKSVQLLQQVVELAQDDFPIGIRRHDRLGAVQLQPRHVHHDAGDGHHWDHDQRDEHGDDSPGATPPGADVFLLLSLFHPTSFHPAKFPALRLRYLRKRSLCFSRPGTLSASRKPGLSLPPGLSPSRPAWYLPANLWHNPRSGSCRHDPQRPPAPSP